ncbi:MAG: ABC transporter permease [Bosea sp. (in: a-proteobacteria)]|uniref:ABC transporter permease n=1 Tax=Bosea sp. (in: a-proteobacteria) TaxID=1871050 RepID=UPI003F7C58D8
MSAWLLRRLLQAFFVVMAMTLIVFIGISVIGDPVETLISQDADQGERLRTIAAFGLDRPLWAQYLAFLNGAIHGDLGNSFVYNEPALRIIFQRMPATLELALAATILSILIGIPLGLYAGVRPRSPVTKFIMTGSILGFSLPGFWVGLLLIMVFAVQLGWLPSGGRGQTRDLFGVDWSFLTMDGLRHLVLPALNLALFKISLVLRLVRAETAEILPQDYIRTARAKGLSERAIMFRHLLRNIMIPVITIIGLEFGSVVAFSVVTETIFAWPGMGKLIIDSIHVLDRPMIVAYLMIIVLLFVVINLLVDCLYTVLDPRVRVSR